MSNSAYSAILEGLHPTLIEVEVDQTPGLPTLQIIGLATHAVVEAKQRITTALVNQKLPIAHRRTVVNLAPTDIKKSSPGLDLAIIIALLKQNNRLKADVNETLFIGEIALDGRLKAVTGLLPILWKALQLGFNKVVVPKQNIQYFPLIHNVEIIPCKNLRQVLHYLKSGEKPSYRSRTVVTQKQNISTYDTILGHEVAKRALQLAAAGDHHLLFIGPPGSGKTKLAQSLIDILPSLTKTQQIETAVIHSVKEIAPQLTTFRPFRSPHHTISNVGLLGGGAKLLPGEISLAHHGVLFVDEVTEFNRAALEALRQPLTEKQISVARTKGNVVYPADFQLIAACNPCPCGFYGSSFKKCTCSPSIRKKYLSKLSGPLLDRIDLVVWLESQKKLLDVTGTTSNIESIQKKIAITRKKISTLPENLRHLSTLLTKPAGDILKAAESNQHLSTRALIKTIQVASTIHHYDQNPEKFISKQEILEALQYRWKDQAG